MELKDKGGKVIAKVTAVDCNDALVDEGVWLEVQADDGTRPTICLIKQKAGVYSSGWYLGVYRDVNDSPKACDFAISFDKATGPVLQVCKGDQVKIVNLYDVLEKLSALSPS